MITALVVESRFVRPCRIEPEPKDQREELWIPLLIEGLTAVARKVPEARAALYELLGRLYFAEGK
jgi:hypothetical protein